MIQDDSDHGASNKGAHESTLVTESSVPLMHHDPDRSWIIDPDPDHPKGTRIAQNSDGTWNYLRLACAPKCCC